MDCGAGFGPCLTCRIEHDRESAGPEEGEAAFEFGEVGVAGGEGGFASGG